MKHALDTQASDVYDTATHDKLTKCSFDFCESFAKEFEMANGAIPPPPPIPDTLGVPDIVVRSREEATSSPTAVKANAKRLAEGRTAKQGKTQQPVSDALDQLSSLGWRVVEAEGKGDCSVLSSIAGYEVKDEKEILNPSASTLKLVSKIRSASVSVVVGSAPIGGLPSKTFRVQEGLAPASQAAAKEMKLWRSNRHWYSENPHESSAFLFGIGLHLDRPIIVLEQGQGGILDPCKIYASRQGDALCREPATNGKAETIPSFFPIPFSDVITSLQRAPSAQSVLLYNGTNHFNALLYGEADDTADDAEVASITSQKAVPVAVRPIAAKAPLPTAIASLQAKTKRANEGRQGTNGKDCKAGRLDA